jgi:hypothetical protein
MLRHRAEASLQFVGQVGATVCAVGDQWSDHEWPRQRDDALVYVMPGLGIIPRVRVDR